jgi:defect-in-organelle-trafficking protein DotD
MGKTNLTWRPDRFDVGKSAAKPVLLPLVPLKVLMSLLSKRLIILSGIALLAGCGSEPKVTPVAAEPDIVTIKLAAAADKAAQALDSIAGIEQQKAPATPKIENFEKASLSQMQPITLRWSGPIETVARALAERAGLKFRVKGNLPTVPLTVNVDVYQQPILHVLRDIGLQAGHRADVAVDDAVGVVEVRYAPADKSQ